jgi:hypothetical protein
VKQHDFLRRAHFAHFRVDEVSNARAVFQSAVDGKAQGFWGFLLSYSVEDLDES